MIVILGGSRCAGVPWPGEGVGWPLYVGGREGMVSPEVLGAWRAWQIRRGRSAGSWYGALSAVLSVD